MHYAITATLGPSSASPDIWREMAAAGATAFRLNTSHLTLEQLAGWLGKIRGFRIDTGSGMPLVLDLQGSKWRLGEFQACDLRPGEILELVLARKFHSPACCPCRMPISSVPRVIRMGIYS